MGRGRRVRATARAKGWVWALTVRHVCARLRGFGAVQHGGPARTCGPGRRTFLAAQVVPSVMAGTLLGDATMLYRSALAPLQMGAPGLTWAGARRRREGVS
jgi:hypothetical protein